MEKKDLCRSLTISIVSYNTCALLRACLTSIQTCLDECEVTPQVIVVDNGSHDGSIEMVEQEFPWVQLIAVGENLGYGCANNLAFKQVQGRYFLILNSDTEVSPKAIEELVRWMDEHPEAGACGPHLVDPAGRPQVTWYRDPNLLSVFVEQTFLDRLPLFNRLAFDYGATGDQCNHPQEVQQITGAGLLVRSELYRQIDGFDPAFFMYYEDTDLCIRIRAQGQKIYYLPQVQILHHLGASSQEVAMRARMIASYNRSQYYFFNRYQGKMSAGLLKLFVLSGALLRLSIWTVLALGKPRYRSQIRLFREVVRRTWKMLAVEPR